MVAGKGKLKDGLVPASNFTLSFVFSPTTFSGFLHRNIATCSPYKMAAPPEKTLKNLTGKYVMVRLPPHSPSPGVFTCLNQTLVADTNPPE